MTCLAARYSCTHGQNRPILGDQLLSDEGFTLIELLVVIAVITALATLVAPKVFRHLGSARGRIMRATHVTRLAIIGPL